MTSIVRFAALSALAACAHARSPAEYAADTGKALAAKDPEIKACYDRVLTTNPTASGRVAVSFVVEPDHGTIDGGRIDAAQTTAPAQLGECVLAAIPAVVVSPPDRKQGQASWVWEFQRPDQLRMR